MARMVGFTRIIRLSWLNKTLELAAEGLDASQMRDELEKYLSFEIKSDTNRRKTREILLLPWVAEDDALAALRAEALELVKSHPYELLPLHWGLLIVAFPMFGDLVRLVGKMSEYQDELTSAQIKQKVLDEWGERSTVVGVYQAIYGLGMTIGPMLFGRWMDSGSPARACFLLLGLCAVLVAALFCIGRDCKK